MGISQIQSVIVWPTTAAPAASPATTRCSGRAGAGGAGDRDSDPDQETEEEERPDDSLGEQGEGKAVGVAQVAVRAPLPVVEQVVASLDADQRLGVELRQGDPPEVVALSPDRNEPGGLGG